ncbi:hypothetical protein E2C01_023045 [Portunus trituberculatus]|uniref:Uncharacterized protein n=1 Tax=Portunus trituberculatus TaxID=210409 RepID=A0A5B7E8W7_PORTR|nr:hypothetical protein [Portunus trituberculatus]
MESRMRAHEGSKLKQIARMKEGRGEAQIKASWTASGNILNLLFREHFDGEGWCWQGWGACMVEVIVMELVTAGKVRLVLTSAPGETGRI